MCITKCLYIHIHVHIHIYIYIYVAVGANVCLSDADVLGSCEPPKTTGKKHIKKNNR